MEVRTEKDKILVHKLDYKFDSDAILAYFNQIKNFGVKNQVCLTYRNGKDPYKDGCGSSYSETSANKRAFSENEFVNLVGEEENPIFDVVTSVKKIAKEEYGLNIGRIRFMMLSSKTCLSYHKDDDRLRFHIPLVTNDKCFFVVDDNVHRMPEIGNLYSLKTDVYHTPVNANRSFDRIHLVFCTYEAH